MKLRLIREPTVDRSTFGVLFVDNHWECFTLEDAIREKPGVPVDQWKVKGQTAIPAGTYPITLTMSARFKVVLPLLNNVPGFEGVRIHTGNSDADSSGCLLPGLERVGDGTIRRSTVAFARLFARLEGAAAKGERITIAIENPKL